jgi:hypothetical protein
MPDVDDLAQDLTKALTDAVYVTVGLGVIAFQRAQVRRQELRNRLQTQLAGVDPKLLRLVGLQGAKRDDAADRPTRPPTAG